MSFQFAPNFGRAIVVPWADSLKESDLASGGPTTFDDLLATIEDLGPAMALGHPSANALEKLAAAIQGVNDFS